MASADLGFGEKPPIPLSDPTFSVECVIRPSTNQAGVDQEVVLPLPDEAYDTSYLRFSLSDKLAASSAEARLLWPVLRLPSMKPQGSACQMSRLGQGEFSKNVANLVASFLWFETGAAATHRSLSVDWAGSCKIVWILSLGIYQRQQHELVETAEEYSNSVGLWITTNKDTFKLLDGFAMPRSMTHQVEVAFQKGDGRWGPSGRWFVGVWVDGLLCRAKLWDVAGSQFEEFSFPPRLHPGELARNLNTGGPDASVVVEWIGSYAEVTDLHTHSGELIRCNNLEHQPVPRIEASMCSGFGAPAAAGARMDALEEFQLQDTLRHSAAASSEAPNGKSDANEQPKYLAEVESACKWERYQCPSTGSIWWWHSDTGDHFHESTGSPTGDSGQQAVWQRFRSPNHGGAVWWWNSLSHDFFFAETGSPEQPA